MLTLGLDIGSSSVKGALVDVETGASVAVATWPETEFPIDAPKPGWAEQNPQMWWEAVETVIRKLGTHHLLKDIGAIGISYQMHGLVTVDKNNQVLRPAIIWCDSRAVEMGRNAFERMGADVCLPRMLNSPGNFTASKLKWVQMNEPDLFDRIDKILLPGDYVALQLTGEASTTIGGLSEGILWDFEEKSPSSLVLDAFDLRSDLLPPVGPCFGRSSTILPEVAHSLGLRPGIPVSYRAGDQPNNAYSLNVLEPGDVAATAGTSGVVYGVGDQPTWDPKSRVNTFAHVNYTQSTDRLGVLLCINGSGSLYRWLRSVAGPQTSYRMLNAEASTVGPGSDGVSVLPFGNGAERMLENENPGMSILGVDFNRHGRPHLVRAALEGVGFAFHYGMQIMEKMDVPSSTLRVPMANLFLSSVFCETIADCSGVSIERYRTDGAIGAACGAAAGAGLVSSPREALKGLKRLDVISPDPERSKLALSAYFSWERRLRRILTV